MRGLTRVTPYVINGEASIADGSLGESQCARASYAALSAPRKLMVSVGSKASRLFRSWPTSRMQFITILASCEVPTIKWRALHVPEAHYLTCCFEHTVAIYRCYRCHRRRGDTIMLDSWQYLWRHTRPSGPANTIVHRRYDAGIIRPGAFDDDDLQSISAQHASASAPWSRPNSWLKTPSQLVSYAGHHIAGIKILPVFY